MIGLFLFLVGIILGALIDRAAMHRHYAEKERDLSVGMLEAALLIKRLNDERAELERFRAAQARLN